MQVKASDYTPFILVILTIPYHVPLTKRIGIQSISWPSIFHAHAWREYQKLTREMLPVVLLSMKFTTFKDER